MTSTDREPYEPPKIEARESVVATLTTIGSLPGASAAFRPTTAYEPPKIERRDSIGDPLVGGAAAPSGLG